MTWPPCSIVSDADVMPLLTGLMPFQLPLGQPATLPLTSGAGSASETVIDRTPRPLWSELPRSWEPVPVAGTGFWPGTKLPPLLVQV
jgi:hypothetical protein